ncbi:MAG: 2-amino-4-hydroxy-6-hydroxymethyldihydropteridine diphosphokinase [Desulfurivibrionaceae bacterium]
MPLVFIGMGSNLGDGILNLRKAWRILGEQPGITSLALSSPYLTRPVAKEAWVREGRRLSEQLFTNAVGVLETDLLPHDLLATLQAVERSLGRDRQKTVDRAVDLDILYYDELVFVDEKLQIPHPGIEERMFVLAPLEELAPDRPHPVKGMTTRQMKRLLPPACEHDLRRLAWPDNEHPLQGVNQA